MIGLFSAVVHPEMVSWVYPKKYAHGLCFVVFSCRLGSHPFYSYPSGLLHWHRGNHRIAPVPVKQPWRIWVKAMHESTRTDDVSITKQSTTRQCVYFMGYIESLTSYLNSNMLNCFKDCKTIYSESYLGVGLTQFDGIIFGTSIHVVHPTQPISCLLMLWRL